MSFCLNCGSSSGCPCRYGPPVETNMLPYESQIMASLERAMIQRELDEGDDRRLHPSTRWARKFLDCRAFPSDVKLLEQYLCQAFNAGARQVVEEVMEATDPWLD